MIGASNRRLVALSARVGVGPELLRSMLSGTALSGLASLATQLPLLGLNWSIARSRGEAGLGDFAVMIVLAAALASFLQFGTGFGATCLVARHLADDPRRAAGHASLAVLLVVCLSMVGGLAFLLASRFIVAEWMGRPDLLPLAGWTALVFVASAIAFPLQGVCIGAGAVRGWALAAIAAGGGYVGLCAAALRGASLETVLAWYGGISSAYAVALAIAATAALRRTCGGWKSPERSGRIEFAHFIAPLGLSGIFMQPVAWFVLAELFRQPGGDIQVGLFNAAISIRAVAMFIPSQANRIGSALVAARAGRPDALRAGVRANAAVSSIGFLLAAAPIAIAAPWVMGRFGPGFAAGADVLLVLLAAGGLDVVQQSFYQRVQAAGRMWRSLWFIVLPREGTMLAAGLLLGADALGLAFATMVSMAIGAAACFAVGRRAVSGLPSAVSR